MSYIDDENQGRNAGPSCPRRDSNPQSRAGTGFTIRRVNQFRHWGPSAKDRRSIEALDVLPAKTGGTGVIVGCDAPPSRDRHGSRGWYAAKRPDCQSQRES